MTLAPASASVEDPVGDLVAGRRRRTPCSPRTAAARRARSRCTPWPSARAGGDRGDLGPVRGDPGSARSSALARELPSPDLGLRDVAARPARRRSSTIPIGANAAGGSGRARRRCRASQRLASRVRRVVGGGGRAARGADRAAAASSDGRRGLRDPVRSSVTSRGSVLEPAGWQDRFRGASNFRARGGRTAADPCRACGARRAGDALPADRDARDRAGDRARGAGAVPGPAGRPDPRRLPRRARRGLRRRAGDARRSCARWPRPDRPRWTVADRQPVGLDAAVARALGARCRTTSRASSSRSPRTSCGATATSWTRALARLHAAGARIALDDAGAGYSGLQQLMRVRPDIVKLDRSLVSGVAQRPGARRAGRVVRVVRDADRRRGVRRGDRVRGGPARDRRPRRRLRAGLPAGPAGGARSRAPTPVAAQPFAASRARRAARAGAGAARP